MEPDASVACRGAGGTIDQDLREAALNLMAVSYAVRRRAPPGPTGPARGAEEGPSRWGSEKEHHNSMAHNQIVNGSGRAVTAWIGHSMASDIPSVGLLHKAGIIRDADIDAAIDAYMADPTTGTVVLGGSGYRLDLGAAVRAHRSTSAVMRDITLRAKYRRLALRTAFLLASPIE